MRRKRLMLALLAVGIGVAVYTLRVVTGDGVEATVVNRCILYEYPVGRTDILLPAYIVSTSVAFFFSSHRSINLIGLMNAAAFLVSYYLYEVTFVSVWCFLAAIVSMSIYLHFSGVPNVRVIRSLFR